MANDDAPSVLRDRLTDLGLRASGLALVALAALVLRTLYHRAGPGSPLQPGALEVLLATVGFLSASAGAALIVVGHHIFDQVRISQRWAYRRVSEPRPTTGYRAPGILQNPR